MERRGELDLDTALRLNGVPAGSEAYRDVAIRVAPGWLSRTWGRGVAAMALPGTVYLSGESMERVTSGRAGTLLVHEATHIDQWRRFGPVRFLIRYLGDYFKGRAVGLPHPVAYRAIRFERQATERAERR
jgi:hypothetical protein